MASLTRAASVPDVAVETGRDLDGWRCAAHHLHCELDGGVGQPATVGNDDDPDHGDLKLECGRRLRTAAPEVRAGILVAGAAFAEVAGATLAGHHRNGVVAAAIAACQAVSERSAR